MADRQADAPDLSRVMEALGEPMFAEQFQIEEEGRFGLWPTGLASFGLSLLRRLRAFARSSLARSEP